MFSTGWPNVWVCGWNPQIRWPFKWKLLSSTFLWRCLLCCTRWFLLLILWMKPEVWPFKWKLLSSTFLWSCLLCFVERFQLWVCGWNPKLWSFEWRLYWAQTASGLSQPVESVRALRGASTFLWCCLLCCVRWFSVLSLWMKPIGSYWAVLSCGSVYNAVQGGSDFESADKILKCDNSDEPTELHFAVVPFTMRYRGTPTFDSVEQILKWKLLLQYFPMVLFIMLYKMVLALSLWIAPDV